ncbi:MAG: penicillin-binding protein 1A, partial [Pyrinomonadaceae bacterium]
MVIAPADIVAAELILSRTPAHKTHPSVRIYCEGRRKSLRRKTVTCCKLGAILIITGFAIVATLTYNSYSNFAQVIDQQIAGGYLRGHAGLYAAPRVIEKGARLSKEQLVTSLQRAGYARDRASNIWSGSFQISEDRVRILPRQGTEKHPSIDVNFDHQGRVASLSANGGDLPSYSLEPELLTVDAGLKTGQQETLTYPDIPSVLVQAILAIEDRRFFEHNGLDIRGIGRAFISWSTSGSIKFRQGGSTITQQLVKNTYLTPEKTLRRKFNEAMIAVALEQRLSKQDIFALYCNEVYLGQRNGVGVRGVAQAARIFFGKELKDISLAEAATLAGMIQSPARYAPDRYPEAAKARRDTVIAAMTRDGVVSIGAAQKESAVAVNVVPFEGSGNELAPYYVDAVNRAMDAQRDSQPEAEQSIRVQTTIDPDLQTAAENALRHQLELIGKSSGAKALPQGALVALDVHTGQVLAMVGGRSYEESQLNRATDAKRQPGSVFKPFVYATALEAGISPLSTSHDAPQTFEYGAATYSPANYNKAYSMHDVLLREGLIRSLNVVTVDLAMRSGLANIAATAARFGLPRPQAYPSMALGTSEATPLQMAAAYAAFANGGTMIEPILIAGSVGTAFDTNAGQMLNAISAKRQIIKPTTAYMITDMLAAVTKRGTARRAQTSFTNVAIAGKTGTSRDGWFVGYTPNLVCAVWVGFDDNKQLGLTGAEAALPAWIDFMKEAIAIRPSLGGRSFPKPAGIVTAKIDPETGQLAGPNCPTAQTVSVASQFAPALECLKHQPEIAFEDEVEDVAWESSLESSDLSSDSPSAGVTQAGQSMTPPDRSNRSLETPYEVNSNLDGQPEIEA